MKFINAIKFKKIYLLTKFSKIYNLFSCKKLKPEIFDKVGVVQKF